jgi:hypothetical protein
MTTVRLGGMAMHLTDDTKVTYQRLSALFTACP